MFNPQDDGEERMFQRAIAKIKADAIREAAEDWWFEGVEGMTWPAWQWLRDHADKIEEVQ